MDYCQTSIHKYIHCCSQKKDIVQKGYRAFQIYFLKTELPCAAHILRTHNYVSGERSHTHIHVSIVSHFPILKPLCFRIRSLILYLHILKSSCSTKSTPSSGCSEKCLKYSPFYEGSAGFKTKTKNSQLFGPQLLFMNYR